MAQRCLVCGRQIEAESSVAEGVGPTCLRRLKAYNASLKREQNSKARAAIRYGRVKPVKARRVWRVASATTEAASYLATDQTCNCPSARYRGHAGTCWHSEAVRRMEKR